jgi:hypothetical protein
MLLHSIFWLLVTVNVVPSSPNLVTLMMKAISSSKTPVLITAMQCNIPEDGIQCSKLFKSKEMSQTVEVTTSM